MPQITIRDLISLPKEQQIDLLRCFEIIPLQIGSSGMLLKKVKK